MDFCRSFFPGLEAPWIFMDNAGGSQIANQVTDRIAEFYRSSYTQLGATYQPSQLAGQRVAEGQAAIARFINAADPAEVIMGSSTTALLRMLAGTLGRFFPKGSEIIVTDCDHEANIGAWLGLERAGIIIKTWKLNPQSLELDIRDLEALLTRQTRLVAFTHASNILGTINPVEEITRLVHSRGALVCVDGVAYAPHRVIDVKQWNVDFYVFSFYKTFGPHYAVLYGKKALLRDLPGCNHFFIDNDQLPYKFQPGHVNFEFAWGLTGLPAYFDDLHRQLFPGSGEPDFRIRLQQVSESITRHENDLSDVVLGFLRTRPGVRIIGQPEASAKRVPTISFVVEGRNSESVVLETDKQGIGIRFGDFYARRLVGKLDLAKQNGVIRVSMVHYNTVEEADKLINVLDKII
jgi:cysteine desulfurase family protein (TIGR01976 family)